MALQEENLMKTLQIQQLQEFLRNHNVRSQVIARSMRESTSQGFLQIEYQLDVATSSHQLPLQTPTKMSDVSHLSPISPVQGTSQVCPSSTPFFCE